MNIAQHMKPETLDRADPHECLLDNLSRCASTENQVTVLRHYDRGIEARERQRIRRQLAAYADSLIEQADEQIGEADKLKVAAQEIQTMLNWTEANDAN